MSERITVLGDGAMGTVCSIILSSNGHRVRLWGAFPEALETLARTRENPRLLPGAKIPASVELTGRDADCFADTDLVVCAVPTQYVRSVWKRLLPHWHCDLPIVSCSKGIENDSLLCPTQVIACPARGGQPRAALCRLSGPNIAGEIARQLPATAVAAAADAALAQRVQAAYSNRYFRVYTNPDVTGVEIAGAVKNVIALAAGIIDGGWGWAVTPRPPCSPAAWWRSPAWASPWGHSPPPSPAWPAWAIW